MSVDYNSINYSKESPFFKIRRNKNATINIYIIFLDKDIDINHENFINNKNKFEIINLYKYYVYNFIINNIDI